MHVASEAVCAEQTCPILHKGNFGFYGKRCINLVGFTLQCVLFEIGFSKNDGGERSSMPDMIIILDAETQCGVSRLF